MCSVYVCPALIVLIIIYPKLVVDSATRCVDSLPHALNVPIVHIMYRQLAPVFLCVSVVLVFTPTFTLYSSSLDS